MYAKIEIKNYFAIFSIFQNVYLSCFITFFSNNLFSYIMCLPRARFCFHALLFVKFSLAILNPSIFSVNFLTEKKSTGKKWKKKKKWDP